MESFVAESCHFELQQWMDRENRRFSNIHFSRPSAGQSPDSGDNPLEAQEFLFRHTMINDSTEVQSGKNQRMTEGSNMSTREQAASAVDYSKMGERISTYRRHLVV